MGNTDSIPLISQAKSLTQYAFGNGTAAMETQNNFIYHNTFPVISQMTSVGYVIAGESDKAIDLQKKFADDMIRIIDSIPGAGHIKGGFHYAMGDNEEGGQAMKAASRSTGVVLGGVGGFVGGGPVGAVAGGIAGGAAMDGIITGAESLINNEEPKPYGYVKVGKDIADAVENKRNLSVEEVFDMAMLPVGDGIAGYAAGRRIGKPLGLNVKSGNPMKPKVDMSNVAVNEIKDAFPHNGNYLGLDKKGLNNRANQLNPNHVKSGPGRPAGYRGASSKLDLDNHANQLNPNNPVYRTG